MNIHTLETLARTISGSGWILLSDTDKALYKKLSNLDRETLDNLITNLYSLKTVNKSES